MNLTIQVEAAGVDTVLHLSGELDAYTAPQLSEHLGPLMLNSNNRSVIVDLTNVTYLDSTGIGIFISALKASKQSGCQLVIQNVTERIERLFRITGLYEIISIVPLKGEKA